MTAIRNSVAGKLQPKIRITGQHHVANRDWMMTGSPNHIGGTATCDPSAIQGSASACTFNNSATINQYTDGLVSVGLAAFEVNLDPEPFATASQYISSSATNITTFVGSGLNDGGFTGPYTGPVPLTYCV